MLCAPPAESGAAWNRWHGWKGAKIKKSGLRGRLGRLLLLSWEELLSAPCDITKGTRFQNSVFHQSPDKCSEQKKDGLFSFLCDIEDVWFATAVGLVCLICGMVQNDFTSSDQSSALEFSPQALGLPWPLVFVPFVLWPALSTAFLTVPSKLCGNTTTTTRALCCLGHSVRQQIMSAPLLLWLSPILLQRVCC